MKPNLVGINHVALQVDDLEEAVAFYTDLFEPTAVSRIPGAAFIQMGDQFLALFERGLARRSRTSGWSSTTRR